MVEQSETVSEGTFGKLDPLVACVPIALELSVVEQLARYFRTKDRLEVVIAGLDESWRRASHPTAV